MQITLRLIEQESELAPYLGSWRRQAPTPMQTPEWMLNWWQAFRNTSMSLRLIAALSENGELCGIAPMYCRDVWGFGTTLRFLGSGSACSDYQTILCAPEYASSFVSALVDDLINEKTCGRLGLIDLDGVSANTAAIELLADRLGCNRHRITRTPNENTWRLELADDWLDVVARLARTQRGQSRTLLNRFTKSTDLALEWVDSREGLPNAFEQLERLHQLRWNSVGMPGCFADPRFKAFLSGACGALAENKKVSIALLKRSGRPIAAALLMHWNGTSFLYQSGRDPAEDRNKLGQMLNLLIIQELCQRGYSAIDFLRGNEVYKSRLRATPIQCEHFRFVPPRTLPLARHRAWLTGREFKHRFMSVIDLCTKIPRVVREDSQTASAE